MTKKRLLAGLLTLVMLVGLLPTAALAAAQVGTEYDTAGLINVANRATVEAAAEASHPKSNLTDGNDSTLWVQNGGFNGVATLTFATPAENVRKVVLKFESAKTTFGVTIKLTVNGQVVDEGTALSGFQNDYIYTFDTPTEVTSLRIDLTDPKDTDKADGVGTFWPAMTEVEVWADEASNPEPPDPNAPEGCINVTKDCEITVEGEDRPKGNMVDGDSDTLWIKGEGWPATALFQLPGNLLVQRVEVEFEKVANRSMAVSLSRAVNNVVSDLEQIAPPQQQPLTGTYIYDAGDSDPLRMTHLQITLDNPKDTTKADGIGTFWPAIAEVRIYAVDEKIDLSKFANVAVGAQEAGNDPTVTKDGSVYTVDFGSNQQVAGFKMALPSGVTGYKIEGKLKKDANWTTYINDGAAADTERVLNYVTGMSAVRLTLTGANAADVTKFEVWGEYVEPFTDHGNLAFEKNTHSNFASASSYLVTDGGKTSAWTADMYPAYVDIDLEANYNISDIEVYTPAAGYTQYSVYTSLNGRDFSLYADKQEKTPGNLETGDVHHKDTPVEARIVRVYLEYYSQSSKPVLNEVRVLGEASRNPITPTPAVNINNFTGTDYAAQIEDADVIAEVQGIVRRQVGENYVNWFTFDLQPKAENGYDYFTLTDEGGKIKVTGNNGVSLATGLNHYLKYFCNVHISQVGNQVKMPASVVPVGGTVHKETKYPVRYAYNYCTHSYSMSFWNAPEWRSELDWLALNGVNVVLDITGQEAVWYKFLTDPAIGYTPQEAKDFLAGPGYYAWAYMANLTGFGGPIHDSFLEERMALGRENQRIMRTLGMEPVLQAFSGMVPVDITTHDPDAAVIPQGAWCSFQRPTMLKTDTATYDKYADIFYKAQKYVFGDAKYYATDPFHEGGETGDMSGTTVASCLLDSLLDFDKDAVWVIQSWQGNPTAELLAGLRSGSNPTRTDRRDHAIVLDLYAERDENWRSYGVDTNGDGLNEFSDTPWVWCMLNNFGGRMGLHGYLDTMQQRIPAAANSAKYMKGVGITPEGSQENPVLYDFIYETVWTDNAAQPLPEIDLEQWLNDYVRRRYGAKSASAEQAMAILAETAYNGSLKHQFDSETVKQGAPESVVNARPALRIGAASTWGYSYIYYDKLKLEKAAKLLLADYETLKESDAYLYDVADVLKQVLSNSAQEIHSKMASAYNSGDLTAFTEQSGKFLALIDDLERVLGSRKEFMFGKWTGGAVQMAAKSDDFTKRLYLRNSKALVTTWGSIQQCESGGLKNYSNRQWAGLTNDFYKVRWQKWIDAAKTNLQNGSTAAPSIDWFSWEWEYARDPKQYSATPNGENLKTLGEQILTDYTVATPETSSARDIHVDSVTAGSEHIGNDENDACGNVLDDDSSTIWHTEWSPNAPKADWWISLDLGSTKTVDGLRYQPRQSQDSGRITGYEIYVSSNGTDWGSPVATGTWANDNQWKLASFEAVPARYVKLLATSSSSAGFVSASEIRVTGPQVPVTGLTLNETAYTLYTNEGETNTLQLTATVAPAGASNKNVSWASSDETIATVDENGLVTAVGVDTMRSQATITATALGAAEDAGAPVTAECVVTVHTKISGSTSISGTPKYGETLTATDNQIVPATVRLRGLSFQWNRNGVAIPNANLPDYVLTAEDIDKSITVTANPTLPAYEGSLTSAPVIPTKADNSAVPADLGHVDCTTAANNDGRVTGLDGTKTYEYQKEGVSGWTPVTAGAAEIAGLAPGNYYVRFAATATHEAGSNYATVTVVGYNVVTYTVTVNAPTGGSLTVSASRAEAGTEITLTATPETGYELVAGSLTVTGASGNVAVTANKFTMPAENVTVAVQFAKKTYTIAHQLENISCSLPEGGHTVEHGSMPTITLTPAEGYALPDTVTITGANGAFLDYRYDVESGVITFIRGITENLTVSGAAVEISAPGVTKTALEAAISAAEAAKDGVEVKPDGAAASTVDKGVKFVTQTEMSTLTAAITDAQRVMDNADADQTTVDHAVTTLNAAADTFKNAIKTGTKETGTTPTPAPSGSSGSNTPTSSTVSHDDGSVTTTVRDPRTGTVTETTKQKDGTVAVVETKRDGTVTETVTDPEGSKSEKVTDHEKNVTITVTDPEGEELVKVELPAELPKAETKFDDVPEGHWAEDAIQTAVALGISKGVGDNKYDLASPMTRGSLATVLHRLSQGKTDYDVTFTDVAQGKYYTEGVAWAAKANVVKGISEDVFAPDQIITREQLAVMLSRYAKLVGMNTKADAKALEKFSDAGKTGAWAVDGVAWCVENGILQGKGGDILDSSANVSRAEVAVMLNRFIALMK